jgi:hypothetical protein
MNLLQKQNKSGLNNLIARAFNSNTESAQMCETVIANDLSYNAARGKAATNQLALTHQLSESGF